MKNSKNGYFLYARMIFYLLADADIEASTIKDHLLYTHTHNRVSGLVYGYITARHTLQYKPWKK